MQNVGASQDPENVVPTTALAPIFDLTTKGIKAKCSGMGAEVLLYPDDPTLEAIRYNAATVTHALVEHKQSVFVKLTHSSALAFLPGHSSCYTPFPMRLVFKQFKHHTPF